MPLLIMKQGIEAAGDRHGDSRAAGAVVAVPAFSGVEFGLIIVGGCWIIIWRGRWRYFGLAADRGRAGRGAFRDPPDIWVERGEAISSRSATRKGCRDR